MDVSSWGECSTALVQVAQDHRAGLIVKCLVRLDTWTWSHAGEKGNVWLRLID